MFLRRAAPGEHFQLIDVAQVLPVGLEADAVGRATIERDRHILSDPGGPGTGRGEGQRGRRAYADDKVVGETGRHSERRMFTLKIV